jgi:hypothetical protein
MTIDSSSEPGAWLRELEQRPKEFIHKWAERNAELHVWMRKMQEVIRESAPGHPILHEIDRVLSNVPQEQKG